MTSTTQTKNFLEEIGELLVTTKYNEKGIDVSSSLANSRKNEMYQTYLEQKAKSFEGFVNMTRDVWLDYNNAGADGEEEPEGDMRAGFFSDVMSELATIFPVVATLQEDIKLQVFDKYMAFAETYYEN